MNSALPPLSISSFKHRFYLEGCPYWWAYDARNSKNMVAKFRNDDTSLNEEDLLEYSWMQLEEMFNEYGYGHVKIVAKKSPTSNAERSPTMFVQWGQAPGVTHGHKNGGVAGAGMFNQMMQMQQMHFQQMMDMQNRINDFQRERAVEEALAGVEGPSWQERLLEESIGLVKDVVGGSPKIKPESEQAALGTMGSRSKKKVEKESGQRKRFSLDAGLPYLKMIFDALPQYDPNDIIKALALFSKQNQDQANQVIGGLIAQLQGDG